MRTINRVMMCNDKAIKAAAGLNPTDCIRYQLLNVSAPELWDNFLKLSEQILNSYFLQLFLTPWLSRVLEKIPVQNKRGHETQNEGVLKLSETFGTLRFGGVTLTIG